MCWEQIWNVWVTKERTENRVTVSHGGYGWDGVCEALSVCSSWSSLTLLLQVAFQCLTLTLCEQGRGGEIKVRKALFELVLSKAGPMLLGLRDVKCCPVFQWDAFQGSSGGSQLGPPTKTSMHIFFWFDCSPFCRPGLNSSHSPWSHTCWSPLTQEVQLDKTYKGCSSAFASALPCLFYGKYSSLVP